MRNARVVTIAALLALLALAGAMILRLPTYESCYAGGGAVEISHRYCTWRTGGQALLREVVLRHVGALGLLTLVSGPFIVGFVRRPRAARPSR